MEVPEEEAIREFVTVTGVEEERARFYLESADWDLQLALGSFYEEGGDDDVITLPQPEPSTGSRTVAQSDARVTSFRDLWHEKDDEDDEGQRFADQCISQQESCLSVNASMKLFFLLKPFGGGGYRLGATEGEQSAYVTGERRPETAQDVHVILKLWKSGFSVDDGELRNYTDPANAQFLEAIRRGEIPLELRRLARGGQVNLDMEDHRDQEFVKSKAAFKAFGGEGQKLGSATPQLVTTTSPAQQAENEAKASSSVHVNELQPTTSIQIRLADGGRLVQKFNHTHSVQDIRHFIIDARPALAYTPFVLMTTFPSKELTNENETLKDANLLNAVIVQRLK
ncbi:LOW QUALITY PROTEIN: NSFL1 cofactor p47-like [Chiloscyllium punctatum]|uniref:LOW QUALITY PROTEIN: NSFL1 cofactor p47-like n=1 Tax=Chiloscyllium punctatum TaxID=137246 RepID=UPI003B64262A